MPSTKAETAPHRFSIKCLPEPNSGCWLWSGSLSGNGYGSLHDGERFVGAHNYSWRLHRGEIPKGMYVCHSCDTPTCVNPDHLFLDTPAGNQQDSVAKGRSRGGASEWKHSDSLKEKIKNDSRSYRVIAEEYGLKFNTVKNLKSSKGQGDYTPRVRRLERELRELKHSLASEAQEYHLALHRCAERYRDMQINADVPPSDPLWKFTIEFMFACRDKSPIPKLCRWLGYIQGVMIERGLTTVAAERDWTRPLFRPLDFPQA